MLCNVMTASSSLFPSTSTPLSLLEHEKNFWQLRYRTKTFAAVFNDKRFSRLRGNEGDIGDEGEDVETSNPWNQIVDRGKQTGNFEKEAFEAKTNKNSLLFLCGSFLNLTKTKRGRNVWKIGGN